MPIALRLSSAGCRYTVYESKRNNCRLSAARQRRRGEESHSAINTGGGMPADHLTDDDDDDEVPVVSPVESSRVVSRAYRKCIQPDELSVSRVSSWRRERAAYGTVRVVREELVLVGRRRGCRRLEEFSSCFLRPWRLASRMSNEARLRTRPRPVVEI